MVKRGVWCSLMLACGCAAQPPAPVQAPPAAAPSSAPVAAMAPPAPAAPPAAFRDCGALACKAFPTAAAAFDFVLAESPRVLAIGEAHAQGDGPTLASSTRR